MPDIAEIIDNLCSSSSSTSSPSLSSAMQSNNNTSDESDNKDSTILMSNNSNTTASDSDDIVQLPTQPRQLTQNDKINKKLLESLLTRVKINFGEMESDEQHSVDLAGGANQLNTMLETCKSDWNNVDDDERWN